MTVEELLQELGVTPDPAKNETLRKWNDKLAALETDSQTKLADATKALTDAQNLQRVINDSIAASGLTETNMTQLQANNAALTAALAARDAAIAEIKKAGFTGLNIPDLPAVNLTPDAKDPVKELTDKLMRGFSTMGQTMNEVNRYQRVFGQPVPEDPATIADRAVAAGFKNVRDYMEQTYKVSAKEQTNAAEAEAKKDAAKRAQWEEEYKAAHPVTNGHPELGPGVPSNYPNIPKPSDATGVKEMAGKSPMEKIRMARDRVTKQVNTQMNAA
jgi:hypothetical protein